MLKAFIQFSYNKVQYYLVKWLNELATHPKRCKAPCSFFLLVPTKLITDFRWGNGYLIPQTSSLARYLKTKQNKTNNNDLLTVIQQIKMILILAHLQLFSGGFFFKVK